jgi:hypothetical protein
MTLEIKPMLPLKYADYSTKVRWDNALAQPQTQGQRCFVFLEDDTVKLVDVAGVLITTMTHLTTALKYPMTQQPTAVLDGFLVDDIEPETLRRRLKKSKADNRHVRLVLYDQIAPLAFSDRYKGLGAFSTGPVTCSETVKIRNREDLNYYQSRCLMFEHQGLYLRHSAENYQPGPSMFFLEVNTAKTQDFNVVDAKKGYGEFTGFGVVICETPNHDEFEVAVPKKLLTQDELLRNPDKYLKRDLQVAYFDLTIGDDPVPKHPVAVAFK